MSYLRDCLRQILLLSLVIGLALGIVALPARATAVYEVPAVSAGVPTWIVDKAEILSLATKGQVKGTLEQLAKQTGKEVRFVTIHRLDYGDTIQVFTDKVFKKWFPTPEDQANQTLIVLDNVTNTIGIQTGTEVKGLLTEAIATSILTETIWDPKLFYKWINNKPLLIIAHSDDFRDRKSTRLNSSHRNTSRMPSSA